MVSTKTSEAPRPRLFVPRNGSETGLAEVALQPCRLGMNLLGGLLLEGVLFGMDPTLSMPVPFPFRRFHLRAACYRGCLFGSLSLLFKSRPWRSGTASGWIPTTTAAHRSFGSPRSEIGIRLRELKEPKEPSALKHRSPSILYR